MSTISTGIYTTIGDSVAYADLGIIFDDLNNNRTINGVKTFSQLPTTTVGTFTNNNQLVAKSYVDSMNVVLNTTNYISYKYNDLNSNNIVMYTIPWLVPYSNIVNVNSKSTITLQKASVVTSSNINVYSDNIVNGEQIITFGQQSQSIWCAGGTSNNTIAYSYDGINWIGLGTNIFNGGGLIAMAYNGKMWVALGTLGSANTIGYSYDGIFWVGLGTSLFGPGQGAAVAWNGFMWLVTGGINGSSPTNGIAYSYDGINWTGLGNTYVGGNGNNILWDGSMWVAGISITGNLGYSYNGINWFPVIGISFTSIPTAVQYNGSTYVALGGGTGTYTAISYDGRTWINTINFSGGLVISLTRGLGWNGYMWIACGDNASNYIYISYDGIFWTGLGTTSISIGQCMSVAWNGIMWVIGCAGNILYSYNGFFWVGIGANIFNTYCDTVIYGARKTNNLYLPQSRVLALGIGTAGTIAYNLGGTNGVANYDFSNNWTWGITNLGASTTTLFSQANSAAWNGYQWIAVGLPVSGSVNGNTLAFSTIQNGNVFTNTKNNTNGTNLCNNAIGNAGNVWTGLGNYIFSTGGYGIGWNGNVWVACGQGGNSLAYSPNGFSWFGLGTTIFNTSGLSVAWNGTYWLATGSGTGNTMAYSPDGVTWTGLGNIIFSTQCTQSVWGGTYWVAVGAGVGNTVAVSWDTKNWFGLGFTVFSTAGRGIAVNNSLSMFVAVGEGITTIAYSADGISWSNITTPGIMGLRGTAVAWNGKFWVASGEGGTHTLAYSADGVTWTGQGSGLFGTTVRGLVANMSAGTTLIPTNYTTPSTAAVPIYVTTGALSNNISMAYSLNNQTWTGITNPVFALQGNSIAYTSNGIWVATGAGGNTLAYSTTGTVWTGLGSTVFTNTGQFSAWNGVMWVAGGSGTNTLAYSYNGTTWIGLGVNVFWNSGNGAAWNGWMWVAVGQGSTNTIAYSYDGINWFGLGTTVFSVAGYTVAWNDILWVAVGQGNNTLAYSYNGQYWIGLGTSIFSIAGYNVVWNGQLWVAVGNGTNAIAWSITGISGWNGLTVTTVSTGYLTTGYGLFWSGIVWSASGIGTQGSTVYSPNGKIWFSNNNNILSTAYAITYSNYYTNKLVLNNATINSNQILEVTTDKYFQSGNSQLIVTVKI